MAGISGLFQPTVDGLSFVALQVEANKELNGVTAEGANVLPAKVIEDAFRHQYNKTLNFTDFQAGMQKVDSWYADRGIFGKVSGLFPLLVSTEVAPVQLDRRWCNSATTEKMAAWLHAIA